MKKYSLIRVCICVVILLFLGSLSNVVGYQIIQSSNRISNEDINQRELLFQTIVDIANNKEIQKVILKYQISCRKFFVLDVRFPAFDTPVLTKDQLKQMYVIGLLLSKIIKKSIIHLEIIQHQLINPLMQQEINYIIEKNVTLNTEIIQLLNSECNCENENTTLWHFPVLCLFLYPLWIFSVGLLRIFDIYQLYIIMGMIGSSLSCFWLY